MRRHIPFDLIYISYLSFASFFPHTRDGGVRHTVYFHFFSITLYDIAYYDSSLHWPPAPTSPPMYRPYTGGGMGGTAPPSPPSTTTSFCTIAGAACGSIRL